MNGAQRIGKNPAKEYGPLSAKPSIAARFGFVKEVWQYRELFYFFILRDIKVRYKQTVLGALWAVIQPFATMIVFTIFFGKFAKMPSEGVPYPVFSYSALVPWTFFSAAVGSSGNSLIGNSELLTKVYFPRFAIPASAALSGLMDFFIASIILFGIMIYYSIPLSWNLLLWPVLVIPLIILSLGLGMVFSSLNVKYRDIKYTIPFIIQILLFVTPIIYPISILPEKYQRISAINPLTGIIEAFRATVIPDKHIDFVLLSFSIAVSLVIFFLGLAYFRNTEKEFADIV
ncbi:MAG: ABC transporter permease [Deltaproteobacteria bacterium]|nr:ABC transporter permease [Deltaproteobacteria bacterium]PWB62055.1 MAG: phosphate ABC transporter permease [Deltaproteobacteria bacterium]